MISMSLGYFVFTLIYGSIQAQSIYLDPRDAEACISTDPAIDPPLNPLTRIITSDIPVIFTSPNFDYDDPANSLYPPYQLCQWQITVTDPAITQLSVGFFNFTLEDHNNCNEDVLEIYDGLDDSAPLLAEYCGTESPNVLTTSTSVYLRFTSDADQSGQGFLTRVGYPYVNTACDDPADINGQVFTSPQGTFMTPDFPVNYDGFETCRYSFRAPAGQRVRITILSFDLAGSECDDDRLEVWQGTNEQVGSLITRFYGDTNTPTVMISESNEVQLKFITDLFGSDSGFIGTYIFE